MFYLASARGGLEDEGMNDGARQSGFLATFFNAFYSRFVLRDFLGKIIPGFILATSIGLTQRSLRGMTNIFTRSEFMEWVMILSMAWVLGLFIQGFGLWLKAGKWRLCRDLPAEYEGREDQYFERMIRLRSKSAHARRYMERLIAARDASGNSATSVFLSVLLFLITRLINLTPIADYPDVDFWGGLAFLVVLGLILRWYHGHLANDRHLRYIEGAERALG